MQTLKQSDESQYEFKLLFLVDFIDQITEKANLGNETKKLFKSDPALDVLDWNKGILNSSLVLENIVHAKREVGFDRAYLMAPLFTSLLRTLSTLYSHSTKTLGEERTKNLFHKIYTDLSQKYSYKPDMEGYLPLELKVKEASSAYGTTIVDNMINFLFEELQSTEKIRGAIQQTHVPEKLDPEDIKQLYINMLGPLGTRQFNKLESLSYNTILKNIEFLEDQKILTKKESDEFKRRIKNIFSEIVGGGVAEKIVTPGEIKKIYIQFLGPLGEKQFKKLENLTKKSILNNINNFKQLNIISPEEYQEFKNKINDLFD